MSRRKKLGKMSLIVLVTYIFMIVMNYLADALPLNGMTTGQVSDSYSNLFAPAGYTFSIWGLIYVLLAFHVIYQLGFFRSGERSEVKQLMQKIAVYFSVTSVANACWIVAWHYGHLAISIVLMVIMLVSLIIINRMTVKADLSFKEKFFIRLPFSIYFGWITIATIANITSFFVSIGWNGWGLSEQTWTVIILIVGTVIGILTLLKNWLASYGIVLVWAYIGIYNIHVSPNGWNEEYPSIILTVSICIILLAVLSLWVWIKRPNRKKRKGKMRSFR